MNVWLILVIALPFLFVIGTVYNALKQQKRLESHELREVLAERRRNAQLPDGHPDKKYQRPYDDEDED